MPLDYAATASSDANATSYTFAALGIGAADANRYVVVATGARSNVSLTVASVTVGGVSATVIRNDVNGASASWTSASLWIALVPTGATASVVVTYTATAVRSHVATWRLVGLNPTPVDVKADSAVGAVATTRTVTLTSATDGHLIGSFVSGFPTSNTVAWTGVVEDYDYFYETNGARVSGGHGPSTLSSSPVTAVPSAAAQDPMLLGVSFQPVRYTATASSTFPAMTQAAAGTVTAPAGVTGTASSVFPAMGQAATGATTRPAFTGTAASVFGALTQAAEGVTTPPVFEATIVQTFAPLEQSAVGVTALPASIVGQIVQTFAPLEQAASATFTPPGPVPVFPARMTLVGAAPSLLLEGGAPSHTLVGTAGILTLKGVSA